MYVVDGGWVVDWVVLRNKTIEPIVAPFFYTFKLPFSLVTTPYFSFMLFFFLCLCFITYGIMNRSIVCFIVFYCSLFLLLLLLFISLSYQIVKQSNDNDKRSTGQLNEIIVLIIVLLLSASFYFFYAFQLRLIFDV